MDSRFLEGLFTLIFIDITDKISILYAAVVSLFMKSLKVSCCIVLYCGRGPAANAPGCTVAEGLLYKP